MSSAIVSTGATQTAPRVGDKKRTPVEALTLEPTLGWWTGNTQFGNRLAFDMPATEGVIVDILDSRELPGPPRAFGATLTRNPRITLGPNLAPVGEANIARNADIYAQITYGAGGVSSTFLMDWSQGGSFALQANTMRISALSYAPKLPADFGAYDNRRQFTGVSKLQLGATIGIDGTPPPRAPTFTTQLQLIRIADLAGAQVTVPPFARRVWPVMAVFDPSIPPFEPVPYAEYVISGSGNFSVWQQYALSDELVSEGIPIPGSVDSYSIRARVPVPTFDLRVAFIFELGL